MTSTNPEAILALLEQRMKQRSENIALSAEQRRAEREDKASATENADYFSDNFNKMKEEIDKEIARAHTVSKSELIIYLDELVKDVGKMQKFLNESSMFLASFQIKIAQETINSTNDLVQGCIKELQPKKKFGFKNKPKPSANKPKVDKAADSIDGNTESSHILTEQLREKFFFGFKNCNGESLSKSEGEIKDRQLNLQNLTNCKVTALGNPSSLQFANLKDTTVFVGPTSRSAFIKDCYNCKFVLACQQIRIHNSQNTNFFIHVTGSAIIENCKGIAFGPYTLQYEELSSHYAQSGLSLEVNYWKNIEDFSWLNENEKSPIFLDGRENCERIYI
ncbi:UNVERIFIED_CONTAM: hypothetical protein GTU68_046834 [Idotea baltica]|nr:hypothetical protein [Idotea baltica]